MGTFMFQALSILAIVEILRLFAVLDDRITPQRLFLLQIFALFSAIAMNSPLAVLISFLSLNSMPEFETLHYNIFYAIPLISLFVSAGAENILLWLIGNLVSRKACEVGRNEEFQELRLQFQKFIRFVVAITFVVVACLGYGIWQYLFYRVFDFAFLTFPLLSLKLAAQIWIFQECRKVALLKRSKQIQLINTMNIPIHEEETFTATKIIISDQTTQIS
jgi:hypothetical protein